MKASAPILHLPEILEKRILPIVQRSGLDNIVVAYPTLREMRDMGDDLPQGASITRKALRSTPIPSSKERERRLSFVQCWPKDGLHSNREPVLMFVTAGRVALPLGDYVLHCSPMQGALISPGTPYPDGSLTCLEDYDKTGRNGMISFTIRGDGVQCWLNHSYKREHWSGSVPTGENYYIPDYQARILLESLADELKNRRPQYRSVSHGLLLAFIALALREAQNSRVFRQSFQYEAMGLDTTLDQPDNYPIINLGERVEKYIRRHLHEQLTIDKVAAYFYMSRTSFTRQYRESTGKSFNERLTEIRMESAKVLLLTTAQTIERISTDVGVTSAHLRILFHEYEGCTPQEFRMKK